jgi:hypothetical protein
MVQIRGRLLHMAAVGVVIVATAVSFDAVTAGATSAGLRPGLSGQAHPAVVVVGTYDLHANGSNFGELDINSDSTFSIPGLGDTGVWSATGTAFAMSITASSIGDTGCTFAGKVAKTGINSAKPKKQGNYACGAGGTAKWWATKA